MQSFHFRLLSTLDDDRTTGAASDHMIDSTLGVMPLQGTDFPDFFGLESTSTPAGGSNSNGGSTPTPHILRRTALNSRSGSALSRLQRRSDFSDSGRASGDSVS